MTQAAAGAPADKPAKGGKRSGIGRSRPNNPYDFSQGPLPDLPKAVAPGRGRTARLRAVLRLALFLVTLVVMIPVQLLALLLDRKVSVAVPFFFHKMLCRILGVRVVVHGRRHRRSAVLFIANHSSWLDIPVMSAVIPASFVAKSEIQGWPIFGFLAKLQRTVFVERERRSRTAESRDVLVQRLEGGDNLILFPEGTSSDGNRILPFKSALFGAAEIEVPRRDGSRGPVVVQPVTVSYTKLQGMPMGRDYRPFFTWFGDMELVPHLLQALSFGPITAEVEFHAPLTVAEAGSRKALARHCETVIRAGHGRQIQGMFD
ncbi:1-acyl-sn-glycerol-3-phosphate acyltransferase [Oleomonas cavernae]|uniref:1-acyl-sn-glycerol-3-phosphate acyltransferase n=1 Tax=Oleomonas cavernae TaxID=2320859 RepID=A0A418WHS3_9PROT|nr:lysophospholipid acyltransferase family protein [Oleomonas cavernae]RJF89550.1 1-acyl-sn-glycerol-3-phosphate acyltransferase [Oleomonas cavernae]